MKWNEMIYNQLKEVKGRVDAVSMRTNVGPHSIDRGRLTESPLSRLLELGRRALADVVSHSGFIFLAK